MEYSSCDGLVLSRKEYGDRNVYLEVLTANDGRITLLSKNAKSFRGTEASACQPFTYSTFEFYTKGTTNIIRNAAVKNSFYDLAMDFDNYLLALYISELCIDLSDVGIPCEDLLRATLNAYYALTHKLRNPKIIKAAFEIYAMTISGYAPSIQSCVTCNKSIPSPAFFDIQNGCILCQDCFSKIPQFFSSAQVSESTIQPEQLTQGVYAALQHCIHATPEKLYSFDLTDEIELRQFSELCESYTIYHLGHDFKTLISYHEKDMMIHEFLGKNAKDS